MEKVKIKNDEEKIEALGATETTAKKELLPKFKELENVEPINADDMACFAEIRKVLEKYNKLDKFGVTLLHRHFDMNDNEILLESTNEKERTMLLEPKILDTNDISAIDTQWYLGKTMPLSLVKCRTSMHL